MKCFDNTLLYNKSEEIKDNNKEFILNERTKISFINGIFES